MNFSLKSPFLPPLFLLAVLFSFLPFLEDCTSHIPVCPPTPVPTLTPSSPTSTPTLSPTLTPSATPTSTASKTATLSPTKTATFTPTNTPSRTPSPTPTNTPSSTPSPTPTNTPTATLPPCVTYTDDFSSSSTLSNYDYFNAATQTTGTASSTGYSISGGLLQDTSVGGLAIVNNSFFSLSLTDYTVEGDFEMDSYAGGLGVFGIAFRTGANGSFYCFQWNGNASNACGFHPGEWEIEKNSGTPSVIFSYPPGTCVISPGYTLTSTIHLKVVVAGNNFQCFVNVGTGDQLIFNTTDSSSPFTSGGVGVRTYGTTSPNVIRIDNLTVKTPSCP